MAGPASGAASIPTFRALTAADLPVGLSTQWQTSGNNISYTLGYAGIGTANPQAVLDLYSAGSGSALILPRATVAARPTGVNGMLRYASDTNQLEGYVAGIWTPVATGAGGASQWTTSAANIYYNSTGNVGVGTATPGAKLSVNGDILANTKLSVGSSQFADLNLMVNGTIYQNGGDPFSRLQAGGNGSARIELQTNGPSGTALDSGHEAGRVDFGGYNGSSWVNQTASVKGLAESTWTPASNPTAISTTTGTTSGERMRITSAGSVGVGTTAPLALLDISGSGTNIAIIVPRATIAQRPTSAVNGMIRYQLDNNSLEAYVAGNWSNISTGASGASQWTTSGSNIYYGSGNVVIGTTAPSYALDVYGTASGSAVTLRNSNNLLAQMINNVGNGEMRLYNTGGIITSIIRANGNSYVNAGGFSVGTTGSANGLDVNGSTAIGTYGGVVAAPSNGLIVSGNVGIGTSAPTAKLHIGGVAGTDGIKFPDGTLQTSAASPPTYDMSCASGGAAGGVACVRINATTGASTCKYTSNPQSNFWGSCTSDPFSATTVGQYKISCSGSGSNGGVICVLTNTLSGSTSCMYTANPQSNFWGSCTSNPF